MKKVTCVMRDATAQHRLKKTTGREKKAIKEKLWKTKVSGSSFFFNNQNLKKLTRFLQKQRWSLRFPATCITSDTGKICRDSNALVVNWLILKKYSFLVKTEPSDRLPIAWKTLLVNLPMHPVKRNEWRSSDVSAESNKNAPN